MKCCIFVLLLVTCLQSGLARAAYQRTLNIPSGRSLQVILSAAWDQRREAYLNLNPFPTPSGTVVCSVRFDLKGYDFHGAYSWPPSLKFLEPKPTTAKILVPQPVQMKIVSFENSYRVLDRPCLKYVDAYNPAKGCLLWGTARSSNYNRNFALEVDGISELNSHNLLQLYCYKNFVGEAPDITLSDELLDEYFRRHQLL